MQCYSMTFRIVFSIVCNSQTCTNFMKHSTAKCKPTAEINTGTLCRYDHVYNHVNQLCKRWRST